MPDMLQKAVSAKADLFTIGSVSVVVSLLIKLSIAVKIMTCHCMCMWRVFAKPITRAIAIGFEMSV